MFTLQNQHGMAAVVTGVLSSSIHVSTFFTLLSETVYFCLHPNQVYSLQNSFLRYPNPNGYLSEGVLDGTYPIFDNSTPHNPQMNVSTKTHAESRIHLFIYLPMWKYQRRVRPYNCYARSRILILILKRKSNNYFALKKKQTFSINIFLWEKNTHILLINFEKKGKTILPLKKSKVFHKNSFHKKKTHISTRMNI